MKEIKEAPNARPNHPPILARNNQHHHYSVWNRDCNLNLTHKVRKSLLIVNILKKIKWLEVKLQQNHFPEILSFETNDTDLAIITLMYFQQSDQWQQISLKEKDSVDQCWHWLHRKCCNILFYMMILSQGLSHHIIHHQELSWGSSIDVMVCTEASLSVPLLHKILWKCMIECVSYHSVFQSKVTGCKFSGSLHSKACSLYGCMQAQMLVQKLLCFFHKNLLPNLFCHPEKYFYKKYSMI